MGHGLGFQTDGFFRLMNKSQVSSALLLTTRFTYFPLSIDLVSQVHLQEFLLLSLGVNIFLNLLQSLLWAKVGLIIKRFNLTC